MPEREGVCGREHVAHGFGQRRCGQRFGDVLERGGEPSQRVRHPAQEQQQQEQRVRERQVRLGAQRARHQEPDAGEGDGSHEEEHHRGENPRAGAPTERDPHDHNDRRLCQLDEQDVGRLRGEQAATRQRCRAQPLQDAVAAFVAGGDAEADHRRRHHRQREHARNEEVDRIRKVGDGVDLREEHEDSERDRQRDEEALGPPEREQQLDPGLSCDRPRLHGRSSLVNRRNTSSSEPRPACRSPRVTSRSRSQAASVAMSAGVAATSTT